MEYKNIMTTNNMYDTVQILADKCREKDLEIAQLREQSVKVVLRNLEPPEIKPTINAKKKK